MKLLISLVLIIIILIIGGNWLTQNSIVNPPSSTNPSTPALSTSISPTATVSRANVIVDNPQPNQLVQSPLILSGKAPGTWFFEAQAPVKLLDSNGKIIASGQIKASGNWQTVDLVSFIGQLSFDKPTTTLGQLVLEKDNPSGLPENNSQVTIFVRFK